MTAIIVNDQGYFYAGYDVYNEDYPLSWDNERPKRPGWTRNNAAAFVFGDAREARRSLTRADVRWGIAAVVT